MKQKQQLVITLPGHLADIPVRVIRDTNSEEIIISTHTEEEEEETNVACTPPQKEYALIRQKDGYIKVALNEILCVEADGNYSIIRLTNGRALTVSFNLSFILDRLPSRDFIQIHRSHVINLRHMESLISSFVKVGDQSLSIGKRYKATFLVRFIFLSMKQNHQKRSRKSKILPQKQEVSELDLTSDNP